MKIQPFTKRLTDIFHSGQKQGGRATSHHINIAMQDLGQVEELSLQNFKECWSGKSIIS